jgi:hypothetical protein
MNTFPDENCVENLEKCLQLTVDDTFFCVEEAGLEVAEKWAKAGRFTRVFASQKALEQAKWLLRQEGPLKKQFLAAKQQVQLKS